MIFLIVFFIVANPATFKIMRGILGSWVASSEGLATPAGLILHAAVFVALAIAIPKYLMRTSGFAISKSRAAANAAEKRYNNERSKALAAEKRLRAEGLSPFADDGEEYEGEEDYESEEEYEGEEEYVETQAQRKIRYDNLYNKYNSRRNKAEEKLKAEGLM